MSLMSLENGGAKRSNVAWCVYAPPASLADHPSARSACTAAGVTEPELPAYTRALAALADSQMITERKPG